MDLPRLIYIDQECGNLEVAADDEELRNNNWTDRGSQKFYKPIDVHFSTNTINEKIFSKVLFQKLLDHRYVEVSSQQLQAHWQQHFEGHPSVEDLMDMDQDTCQFFHQDFSKCHETKINEGALKIITRKKIIPRTSKNIAPK